MPEQNKQNPETKNLSEIVSDAFKELNETFIAFFKSHTPLTTFLIPDLSNIISVDIFLPDRISDVISFRSNKRTRVFTSYH